MNCEKHIKQIRHARKIMGDALKADSDFAHSYIANIACVIMDFQGSAYSGHVTRLGHTERQILATEILDHIFKDRPYES